MAERQTFAFEVQAPVQGRPSAQGGGQIAQTVGGQVTGGDRSGFQADNSMALGGFLDGLLAPYAERKAKEQFAKGVTDQMYAEAGQEVRAGNGLLTKIFGPTAYEEGAVFYEAQKRIAQAQTDWANREDELKRMSSDEVAKQWADHLEATKVGDYYLDQMISDEMLKATPQMLQSVAKASYKYQQEEAAKSQAGAWEAYADTFQQQAASFAATADPDETQIAGYNAATQSFLNMFIPIKGQTDESYVKNLTNVMRRFAQKGNGHAITALLRSGASDVLSLEDRVKVETMYNREGMNAVRKAAASPEVMALVNDLERDMARWDIMPEDALKRKLAINEKIKRATGFNIDLYDTEDQTATIRSVWSDIAAGERRLEDQQFQIDLQEDQQAFDEQLAETERNRDTAAADMAFASNSPGIAIASGGVKPDVLNMRILQGYLQNDFAGVNRMFKDGIITPNVKDAIANTISTNVSNGYSAEFEGLVQKFDAMHRVNPAMAKEYFGNAFAAMRTYQSIRATGAAPDTAFASAFGDDTQYLPSGAAVATASKEVVTAVQKANSKWFATNLNEGSQRVLSTIVARTIAADKGHLTPEAAINRAYATNAIEVAGPLAWSVGPNNTPMYKALGVPRDIAEKVIFEQIDVSLRNRGFADGANGEDYQIVMSKRAGQPVLVVTPKDEDGIPQFQSGATITVGQLRQAVKDKQVRDNRAKGILSAEDQKWARIDPARRIKGEKVMDRVIRINKERALRKANGIPEYPIN